MPSRNALERAIMEELGLARLPPYSEDAERSVLGSILKEPDSIRKCIKRNLTPEHFYIPANRIIFNAMLELQAKGKPTDALIVSDRLKETGNLDSVGGSVLIDKYADEVPTTAHLPYYIDIVIKKFKRRSIIQASRDAEQLAYTSEDDEDALISHIRFNIGSLIDSKNGAQTIPEAVKELVTSFQTARSTGVGRGLESRWFDLQHKNTGYKKSQQTIVAGRPGQGKTTLGFNECLHLALKSVPVLIVSMEMDLESTVSRIIGDLMGLNMQEFDDGKASYDDVKAFIEGGKILVQLPLYIVTGNKTIEQYDSIVREHVTEFGVKFVLLDYIQIFKESTNKKHANRNLEVAYQSNMIVQLGNDTKIHQMLISQLRRSVNVTYVKGGKKLKLPKLDDLRDSGALEQDADVVIFLQQDPEAGEEEILDMAPTVAKIAKNRFGPTGYVDLVFQKTKQRLLGSDNLGMSNDLLQAWRRTVNTAKPVSDDDMPF